MSLSASVESLPARRRLPRWSAQDVARMLSLPLVVGLILAVWELLVIVTGTNEVILPRPTNIFRALAEGFSAPINSRASYVPHIRQTLGEVLAGYALGCSAGLALATLSVRFPLLEFLTRPLVVAFQSVPKVALAPLVIIWFGFGFNSKFALVTLATFFPLFVNGIAGFKSVDEGPLRMMRSFGASGWQVFTKVTFPAALPYIFAGLEIALVHAITSAIAAEFLGGQMGLGVMILQMEQLLETAAIFSVLMILAAIGWLLSVALGIARRRIVHWAPVERHTAER
jgi:NitT/TauT family transport system permease protein